MIKVANIIHDEKFIDGIIEVQDLTKDKCCHDYIHVNNNPSVEFKLIKYVNRIKIVKPEEFHAFLKEGSYDAVFLHSLFTMPIELIPKIDRKIKVFWFGWGYDMYTQPSLKPAIRIPLNHEKTIEVMANHISQEKQGKTLYQRINGRRHRMIDRHHYEMAVRRVDYFSGVLPVEYDMIKNNWYFKAKKVVYCYISLKTMDKYDNPLPYVEGRNILVGNSADANNNHLDVLPYLEKLDLSSRKVYVPLSYAGQPYYIDAVVDGYKKALGEKAILLMDFLPIDEYRSIVGSCGIAIFFHERQQAMGNVEMSLWNGCKVFLSETSVAYRYLKGKGFNVYTIQQDLNQEELDKPLTNVQRDENRKILYSIKCRKQILANLDNIYGEIYRVR